MNNDVQSGLFLLTLLKKFVKLYLSIRLKGVMLWKINKKLKKKTLKRQLKTSLIIGHFRGYGQSIIIKGVIFTVLLILCTISHYSTKKSLDKRFKEELDKI